MASINVLIMAGGRGSATIIESMIKHKDINLKVLVNAYDDGLSTGRIRALIPGMLGPSDVRKNISRMISGNDSTSLALKKLLEHRLEEGTSFTRGCEILFQLQNLSSEVSEKIISGLFRQLSLDQAKIVARLSGYFLSYVKDHEAKAGDFDFGDCSFGNILFAGAYLECGSDFNKAIELFNRFCLSKGEVLNITQGENLVLVGLKEDGSILINEAEIVAKQNSSAVKEIFLLEQYLTLAEEQSLKNLSLDEKRRFLSERSKIPEMNPVARETLETSDIIIYGPGTQHSSLFPSYLTHDVVEVIASNTTAEKIFISNILEDNEIQGETANSLAEKLLFYLNRKGQCSFDAGQVVTRFFFQETDAGDRVDKAYVQFKKEDFKFSMDKVVLINWEIQDGVHSGGRVLDELVSIVNSRLQKKLRSLPHMVSIIVPALNEAKTVKKVLHDLHLLDFHGLGIGKEIIFVDGGSSDNTYELARSETEVRAFRSDKKGRGSALRFGISKASGNIIVFFPSDAEYDPRDLFAIVNAVVTGEFQAVFGSRLIKCVNLTQQISEIYRGNWLGYLVSKYGGITISMISLLFYNRYISDTFTSIKAFEAGLLKDLKLCSEGVDLETEIIAKLSRRGVFILELPVNYSPRTKSEGKKTTIWDGLKALFVLLKYRVKP